MASTIFLFALATACQMDADEERRQVHEIQLGYRLGDLNDRANHADAIYLDVLAPAAATASPDGLERGRENYRLLAENSRLPFDQEGYVSYWLKLKRLGEAYAEVAPALDKAGLTIAGAHARRQAALWTERASAMGSAMERSKAETRRIDKMRRSGELGSQSRAFREKLSPIYKLGRFLGTIPPVHALAVIAAVTFVISSRRSRANR